MRVWEMTDRHSEWTRHNTTQTGLKFFKLHLCRVVVTASAEDRDTRSKRGIHVCEKALRRNRVEPVVNVRRTTD